MGTTCALSLLQWLKQHTSGIRRSSPGQAEGQWLTPDQYTYIEPNRHYGALLRCLALDNNLQI